VTTFLLVFTALFSIINPISNAFIFLSATEGPLEPVRPQLARWITIHSFLILAASLYVGAYVLSFFGISLPVLRVGGGLIIAMSAWRLLNVPEQGVAERSAAVASLPPHAALSRLAFYPLTMPLTTGPGTISVAVSLGANRPHGFGPSLVSYFLQSIAATILVCALILLFYRHAGRMARLIGPTGTAVVVRLTAFLLFCIGIQVLWTGLAELLAGLPGGVSPA
jgi:multiple antibiotic resistance protein